MLERIQQSYKSVSLADSRQDVHKTRVYRSSLNRFRVALSLLPKGVEKLNLLELGGGAGEFSDCLISKGVRPTFVDMSDANIKRAINKGLSSHKLDLNEGLECFGDAAFDGIFMLEIIEHIVSSEFLLKETSRVLKPGGFLVLSTPNFNFIQNRFRILFGSLSVDEGYHYRFFNPAILEDRLRDAGFRVSITANSMPAFGINFMRRKLLKMPRMHVKVPRSLSGLFAHTLIVKAIKE